MQTVNWKSGARRLAILILSIIAVYSYGYENFVELFKRSPFRYFFDIWGVALTVICYYIVLDGRPLTLVNKLVAFGFSFLIPVTVNFLDATKATDANGTDIFFSLLPYSNITLGVTCSVPDTQPPFAGCKSHIISPHL